MVADSLKCPEGSSAAPVWMDTLFMCPFLKWRHVSYTIYCDGRGLERDVSMEVVYEASVSPLTPVWHGGRLCREGGMPQRICLTVNFLTALRGVLMKGSWEQLQKVNGKVFLLNKLLFKNAWKQGFRLLRPQKRKHQEASDKGQLASQALLCLPVCTSLAQMHLEVYIHIFIEALFLVGIGKRFGLNRHWEQLK